eukprot:gene34400-46148_t
MTFLDDALVLCSNCKTCTSSSNILIPTSLKSILNNSFSGASCGEKCDLVSVLMPTTITNIGTAAFRACSSLMYVNIPTSVTAHFPEWGMTSLVIPTSVTRIGASSFSNCLALKTIMIPTSVVEIGAHAFAFCTAIQSIVLPTTVSILGDGAFRGDTILKSFAWNPSFITSLGSNIFNQTGIGLQSSCPTAEPSFSPLILRPSQAPSFSLIFSGARLVVTVLDYSFYSKQVSLRSSACAVTSIEDSFVLNLILRIENIGTLDFILNNQVDLTEDKCSKALVFKSFYKFYFANITKTRSENCIADVVSPIRYNCLAKNQGISVNNFFISQQWMDVSAAQLVKGQSYNLAPSFLITHS